MSVPPHGPEHGGQQWGSGIPGIPSVWDRPPEGGAQPVWIPPTASRRPTSSAAETRSAQRWGAGALAAVALLLVAGVMSSSSGTFVEQGPVVETFYDAELAPAPAMDPGGRPELAAQVAGGREPFGLALGTPVLVDELGTGLSTEVRPAASRREQGRLEVDVTLTAVRPQDGPAGLVRTPLLVVRTADGRELPHVELAGEPGYPEALSPGEVWQGRLVFETGPEDLAGDAVLAAVGVRTVAGWVLPPG
jgi:hypothetical protein